MIPSHETLTIQRIAADLARKAGAKKITFAHIKKVKSSIDKKVFSGGVPLPLTYSARRYFAKCLETDQNKDDAASAAAATSTAVKPVSIFDSVGIDLTARMAQMIANGDDLLAFVRRVQRCRDGDLPRKRELVHEAQDRGEGIVCAAQGADHQQALHICGRIHSVSVWHPFNRDESIAFPVSEGLLRDAERACRIATPAHRRVWSG